MGGTKLNDHDRIVGRIPEPRRREILDSIVRGTQHGSTVQVERSWSRKVDEIDEAIVGRILGLAWAPGGSSSFVLIVDPVDPRHRMCAISVSQLVRIRWAHDPQGGTDPAAYELGAVIAGPPL